MSNLEKAIEVAQSEYFTGLARLIMIVRLGYTRKRQIIRAGLGASTIYLNLLKATQRELALLKGDEIKLTPKGEKIADILLEAFDKLCKIEH